jgi:hypothetical protein
MILFANAETLDAVSKLVSATRPEFRTGTAAPEKYDRLKRLTES